MYNDVINDGDTDRARDFGGNAMTLTENPFLAGNYGPVHEERTATDLVVEGNVPAELRGRYLRIGPNPFVDPTGPYHWFTGDGMVHGVELGNGTASWYRNRWVRTDRSRGRWGSSRSRDRCRRCTTRATRT